METRQELVLKFMLAIASSDYFAKNLSESFGLQAEKHARDVYLAAAILTDQYLQKV